MVLLYDRFPWEKKKRRREQKASSRYIDINKVRFAFFLFVVVVVFRTYSSMRWQMEMEEKKGIMRSQGKKKSRCFIVFGGSAGMLNERKTVRHNNNNENNHKSDVKMINNGEDSLARLANL